MFSGFPFPWESMHASMYPYVSRCAYSAFSLALFVWLFVLSHFILLLLLPVNFLMKERKRERKNFGGWGGKGDLERAGG